MNEMIIKEISKDLEISEKQVTTVLSLLSEGNTVPFIARYRKEATGALDEEMIRKINEVYEYQNNFYTYLLILVKPYLSFHKMPSYSLLLLLS